MAFVAVIVFLVACGILSAMVASSKGRDATGWFILGVLLGPLALLASVGMSAQEKGEDNPNQDDDSEDYHDHEWEDEGEVKDNENPVVQSEKCAICGLVRSKPHEHEWSNTDSIDQVGAGDLHLKRCKVCGLVEELHEHSWGDVLPSKKHSGRLYQRCTGCDDARYIDAPAAEVQADHEHQWAAGHVAHPTASGNVLTSRCGLCGLTKTRPHNHSWGEPRPSGIHEGRLYQECEECQEATYIN